MLKSKKADRGKLAEFPKLKEGLIGWRKERKLINIRISKTGVHLKALVMIMKIGTMPDNFITCA